VGGLRASLDASADKNISAFIGNRIRKHPVRSLAHIQLQFPNREMRILLTFVTSARGSSWMPKSPRSWGDRSSVGMRGCIQRWWPSRGSCDVQIPTPHPPTPPLGLRVVVLNGVAREEDAHSCGWSSDKCWVGFQFMGCGLFFG
jgi:hypothetical protein